MSQKWKWVGLECAASFLSRNPFFLENVIGFWYYQLMAKRQIANLI